MNKFIVCFLLLAMVGCAIKQPTPIGSACPPDTPPLSTQWYNSGHGYMMRHEGVLQFGSATLPMSSMMKLDTKAGTARVVILTSMGIKMLAFDLTTEGYTILSTSPAAERIPGFIEGAVESVRRVYLTPMPRAGLPCYEVDNIREYVEENQGGMVFRIDADSGQLIGKESAGWRVEYGKPAAFDLPEDIRYFHETGRRFTVTLKLIDAKRL